MTILVTGSAGHLGEALVRMLKERGDDVRGLDIKPSPFTDIVGSIVDANVCHEAMVGVRAVLHTASLHKPHVATHSEQNFVDVNITGTLNLLQASVDHNVSAFVFTSTTSSFGSALTPKPGDEKAVWINESVVPVPKNIYGVTKTAAEDLCLLFWKLHRLPCIVLKVARFFPEEDDTAAIRDYCSTMNAQMNELLFRRADIYDMATAHLQAIKKAPALGFDKFIVSGSSPFSQNDLPALYTDAPAVVKSYFPDYENVYERKGWKMFLSMDRVYCNDRAREILEWSPVHTFAKALENFGADDEATFGSELARVVGKKGYHA